MIAAAVTFAISAFSTLVVQFKRRNPDKSYPIALLNIILGPMRAFGLGPYQHGDFTPEIMMKAIAAGVGLDDFGDLAFLTAYHAVNKLPNFIPPSQYTNFGYIMAIVEFELGMTRRLKVTDYLKHNPTVTQIPVHEPIFVFGLGRSGTTFLHRLLHSTLRSDRQGFGS